MVAVPVLGNLLQADDVDAQFVDRLGDAAELGVLIRLLVAVQVEGLRAP